MDNPNTQLEMQPYNCPVMAIASYQQALDFWFGRVNYEHRGMPQDLRELKLERMELLLEMLGRPQDRLKIVHIAGSKGKGSTAAMFASAFQAAGLQTGLFTSPHLTTPEERIQVQGVPIPPADVRDILRELEAPCRAVAQELGSEPTFFEIATGLGLLYFVRRRVHWAVLEVGLGGRFDSTNVCQPKLAVITSISFDHQAQLGNTLALIAGEKAGIIKPDCPTVSGIILPEPRAVIESVAKEHHAPLRLLGRDFHYAYKPGRERTEGGRRARVRVHTWLRQWPWTDLALLGEHQAANAAVALAGFDMLAERGEAIPEPDVCRGLAEVRWPARMEVVRRHPLVVLDCAHNVASVEALLGTLQSSFPAGERTLLFGGSRDKDLAGMLRLLAPQFARAVFTRYLASPRSLTPKELGAGWRAAGGGEHWLMDTPAAALSQALNLTPPGGLLCATGSVFLAGELRPLLTT